jgi:tryptophan-rich sensory protein
LRNEDRERAGPRWNDAASAVGAGPGGATTRGECLIDARTAELPVPPEAAFAPIRRIGGRTGWYYGNWLWRLRGGIDLLCGGVGLRRGRRDPDSLRVGDTVDWWRVEAFEPDRRLLLRAEMKLPGRAWLEFTAGPAPGGTRIGQTAIYEPAGIGGRAYWYMLYPVHQLIFSGMLRGIVAVGRGTTMPPSTPPPSLPRQLAALLVLLAACFGTAAVGAALTAHSVRDWYPNLRVPAWAPPNAVFGPVWTVLYALMALAAWLVWRGAGGPASRPALGLFAVQLGLNAAWSGLFFALRSPGAALAEIILLWCAIGATILSFRRLSALAAGLLVPYLLWVTFAAALNGAIWWMNS